MLDTPKFNHGTEIEVIKVDTEKQPDWKKHFDYALKRVKDLTGLELTNLEKVELRSRIKQLMKIKQGHPEEDNSFSVGNEAAVWFLKENYGYDSLDAKTLHFLSGVSLDHEIKGGEDYLPELYFKIKQDKKHKP